MCVYTIQIIPIEPLLFRDQRAARAGQDHDLLSNDMAPHTLYGAISANILAKHDARISDADWSDPALNEILGSFCPDLDQGSSARSELMGFVPIDATGKLWFPKPQHFILHDLDGAIGIHLQPVLMKTETRMIKLTNQMDFYLHMAQPEKEDESLAWIDEVSLSRILCGEVEPNILLKRASESKGKQYASQSAFFLQEYRAGLGMENEQNRVLEGILFSRPYRRFCDTMSDGVWRSSGFIAFFKTLTELRQDKLQRHPIAFLGGDGGRVHIRFEHYSGTFLPDLQNAVLAEADDASGFFVYLLTAAIREQEWPVVAGRQPVAAAIGREKYFSGWNTSAQSPRSAQALIPEGSVFFYPWPHDRDRSELVKSLWLEPVQSKYRNSGFGRMLIGVWHE